MTDAVLQYYRSHLARPEVSYGISVGVLLVVLTLTYLCRIGELLLWQI